MTSRLEREEVPPLYALTPNLPDVDPGECLARLIAGGARWIQVREKWCSDADLIRIVGPVAATAPSSVRIFVNDRIDLAIGSGADGVHLGDRDLPAAVVAAIRGARRMIIGVSTHSVDEAVEMSKNDAVDYVALGPIFASSTKMVREPLGLDPIARLRSLIDSPIVAIGGIDRTNIGDVLRAGADSAAVISALYQSGRIEDNVGDLIDRAEERK